MEKIDRYANHELKVQDDKLVIEIVIDESQVDVQKSSSGKTFVVSTTGGAIVVPGTPYRLNMTLYRKP